MPIQSSGVKLQIPALSARLLGQQEVKPRARTVAQAVTEALPGSAVNVYGILTATEGDVWTVLASAGDVALPEPTIPLATGALGILASEMKPIRFEGNSLIREEFAHLHVRRTLRSLSYLPLVQEETRM